MIRESCDTQRWETRSRQNGGVPTKTNPNRKLPSSRPQSSPEAARSEFPDRANPNFGRAPLTEDQKELARRYLPLARSLAKQLRAKRRMEREDIESIAFVALVEAAKAYDPTSSARFSTFARYRIVGAILDHFRKIAKTYHLQSSTMVEAGGSTMEVEHYGIPIGISPNSPVGAELDSVDTVEAHFRRMSAAQAQACRLIYLEGKTQEEVAKIMGCTASYISKIHREALLFLVERFGDRREVPPVNRMSMSTAAAPKKRKAWRQSESFLDRTRIPASRPLATAC